MKTIFYQQVNKTLFKDKQRYMMGIYKFRNLNLEDKENGCTVIFEIKE